MMSLVSNDESHRHRNVDGNESLDKVLVQNGRRVNRGNRSPIKGDIVIVFPPDISRVTGKDFGHDVGAGCLHLDFDFCINKCEIKIINYKTRRYSFYIFTIFLGKILKKSIFGKYIH
jgi:hypothetical protein